MTRTCLRRQGLPQGSTQGSAGGFKGRQGQWAFKLHPARPAARGGAGSCRGGRRAWGGACSDSRWRRGQGEVGAAPARSRARTHSSPCRRLRSVMGRTVVRGGSASFEGRKHRLSFSSRLQAKAGKLSPHAGAPASASALALQFSWSWTLRAGSWNS